MAIHVYFMLFAICVLFGASFQQRHNLRKRLSDVESMAGSINVRTSVDISQLREAVEQLQNKSEENSRCDTDLSPVAAAITHLESRLGKQVEYIKEDILELRKLLMKTQQRNTELDPSSNTKITMPTQDTTTKLEPSTSTATLPMVEPECPDGWSKFLNSCYLFEQTRVGWDEPNRRCAGRGAILAEPDTREKLQYLYNLSDTVGMRYYMWVGRTDGRTEGTWVWRGSERPVVSSLWSPGQPNGGDDENCLLMWMNGWYDGGCRILNRPFLCEKQVSV